jgi:hypothetical protein
MENFIDTDHTYALRLPLARLKTPREVFNVDKTPNRQGPITHYTDTAIRTGGRMRTMRFFLTHLGGNPLILGYPWFSGMEPRITWSKGWIDYDQLPITLTPITSSEKETPPEYARRLVIATLTVDKRQTLASKLAERHNTPNVTAAYATIMYRLGVVVTRLPAAAFWLGCVKQMVLSMQDEQETQLSNLESLLSRIYTRIQGTRAQGTEHNLGVLRTCIHRAESQATRVVRPHPTRHTVIYTNRGLLIHRTHLPPWAHPCG